MEGGDILIDMKAFVDERLHQVELSPQRAKEKTATLLPEEVTKVRSTCGALNWAGREGRPDMAAAASMYSALISKMTVADVLELNKTVAQLKQSSEVALRIQALSEEDMRWGVISDASYANAGDGRTQAGHLLIAFEKGLLAGENVKVNVLHWRSAKLKRVVSSTLAAETQSLARGVGDLLWMMVMYQELTNAEFELREWRKYIQRQTYTAFSKYEESNDLCDAVALIDAKSLYDVLAHETTGGSDKRTALDIQVLREELQTLSGRVRWVDHMHMPADCLTKRQGRSDLLKQILRTGKFGITSEAMTLAERLQERTSGGYNRR